MPFPAIAAALGRVGGQLMTKIKPPAGGPKPPGGAPQANGAKPGPNGQNTPHDFGGQQKPGMGTMDKVNMATNVASVGMMIPGLTGGGTQGANEPGKEGHGRPKHTPVGSDTY